MTNTSLRILPAHTDVNYVQDMIQHLASGVPAIVAVEIFDHPKANSEQGTWAIGTRAVVEEYLEENGYENHAEQYSAGRDPEEIADDVPARLPLNGQTVTLYRYPNPSLKEGDFAGWMVERANFADNATFLGVLWMSSVGCFRILDRHGDRVAVGFDVEAVLGNLVPAPKPEPVTVRLVLDLEIDPTAWMQAYGVLAEEIPADVESYVQTILGECSQRSANTGGEGGLSEVTVRRAF